MKLPPHAPWISSSFCLLLLLQLLRKQTFEDKTFESKAMQQE
jgi:hypothetical protein